MRSRTFALGTALCLSWLYFGGASAAFLGARNLSMLAIELSITAVLALGMLLVLLPGLIDLSVGSGVGLLGGVASVLVFRAHWPAPLAMLAAAAIGLALWTLMGLFIVRARMPAFIVTLGGLLVFKGLFWRVIENATVPVVAGDSESAFSRLTTYFFSRGASVTLALAILLAFIAVRVRRRRRRQAHDLPVGEREIFLLELLLTAQALLLVVLTLDGFRGVPLALVILAALAASVHLVTTRLPFGRYLYAIGDNALAARLAGVPVERTIVTAFAALGVVVALTGLMQTAYAGAATTTVGDSMELDAIAACVIGGTSLRGGKGTVLGVLFGALIMATLQNGMTLLAVSPELKLIARGGVLVVAVWLDVVLAR